MSLKGFHILFIVFSVIVSFGFFAWTVVGPQQFVTGSLKIFGGLSGVFGLGLAVYAVWFIKKKSRTIIS